MAFCEQRIFGPHLGDAFGLDGRARVAGLRVPGSRVRDLRFVRQGART